MMNNGWDYTALVVVLLGGLVHVLGTFSINLLEYLGALGKVVQFIVGAVAVVYAVQKLATD